MSPNESDMGANCWHVNSRRCRLNKRPFRSHNVYLPFITLKMQLFAQLTKWSPFLVSSQGHAMDSNITEIANAYLCLFATAFQDSDVIQHTRASFLDPRASGYTLLFRERENRSGEQRTGNREQGTGKREQGTGNREQGTGNRERGMGMGNLLKGESLKGGIQLLKRGISKRGNY